MSDAVGAAVSERLAIYAEGLFADALATHPPMAKRIAILRGMGYAQLKQERR